MNVKIQKIEQLLGALSLSTKRKKNGSIYDSAPEVKSQHFGDKKPADYNILGRDQESTNGEWVEQTRTGGRSGVGTTQGKGEEFHNGGQRRYLLHGFSLADSNTFPLIWFNFLLAKNSKPTERIQHRRYAHLWYKTENMYTELWMWENKEHKKKWGKRFKQKWRKLKNVPLILDN